MVYIGGKNEKFFVFKAKALALKRLRRFAALIKKALFFEAFYSFFFCFFTFSHFFLFSYLQLLKAFNILIFDVQFRFLYN